MEFSWNGERVENLRDVLDIISVIDTKPLADDFLAVYASNVGGMDNAKHNIGWLSGELSDEKRVRVCQLFETVHPVIGVPITVTDEVLKDASGRMMWGSNTN